MTTTYTGPTFVGLGMRCRCGTCGTMLLVPRHHQVDVHHHDGRTMRATVSYLSRVDSELTGGIASLGTISGDTRCEHCSQGGKTMSRTNHDPMPSEDVTLALEGLNEDLLGQVRSHLAAGHDLDHGQQCIAVIRLASQQRRIVDLETLLASAGRSLQTVAEIQTKAAGDMSAAAQHCLEAATNGR